MSVGEKMRVGAREKGGGGTERADERMGNAGTLLDRKQGHGGGAAAAVVVGRVLV